MKACKATKADGTPRQAAALVDSDHCFFHAPDKAAARLEAQSDGGRQNGIQTLDSSAPRIHIHNSKDVMVLLSETIGLVLAAQVDPRTATAVGYLANLYLKASERNALEERLERIERALQRSTSEPELLLTGD